MSLGALTWTCLFLSAAAGGGPADEQPMNQRAFQIPIHFDPQKRAEIQNLQLFVSHDKGATWTLAANATPDKDHFDYAVAEDGSYWFTMVIVDQQGRADPPNVFKAAVGQKLLVDTTKPDVHLTADRHGDTIQVNWSVQEANPKTDTLKLEYSESPEGPWVPVPMKAGWTGQAEFQDSLAVTVRMQLRDVAENLGQAIKQVPAANGGPTLPPPAPPPVVGAAPPTPLDGPPPPLMSPFGPPPPAVTRPADHTAEAPHLPAPPLPAPADPTPAPTPLAVAPKTGDNTVVAYTPPVGATPPAPLPPPALPDAPPAAPPHPEMPALQIVNKRQIKLEFDVGKYGPSGLGGVDLYITGDDGTTWVKTTPDGGGFQPAAAGAGGAMRGSVTVSLQNEGVVYGYYLVVKSKAGLGKPPPHAGDLPQLRVELDVTPPEAALFKPQADPAKRDTLVLIWKASDRNLAANPVTLEWSAQGGPAAQWNLIGPGELANSGACVPGSTGSYAWQPTPEVPPSVYLRLTVRDTAGNRSVAETPNPVLIDLSIPEVTNIGLGGANPGQH